MTKDPAAQRCADLANAVTVEHGGAGQWSAVYFVDVRMADRVAFRRYVQSVSDALEEAQPGGFTIPPGLTQYVLAKPVNRLAEE